METLSVRCNHCGAPLEVGASTRFVTCQFCHSPLEVKRTDSSIFTEEVARIAENTEKMAGSLETIQIQNELERLDREWAAGHSADGQPGTPPAPPARQLGSALFGMGFSVFFALVCFGIAGTAGSMGGGIFSLVPAGMGIFALIAAAMGLGRAATSDADIRQRIEESSRRTQAYQEKRAALLKTLESRRSEEASRPPDRTTAR